MADLPQYTGVSYDNAFYRSPEESMYDYMRRLAAQRSKGVLGGGGMLDAPAPQTTPVAAPVLGQLVQNRNDGGVEVGIDTRTDKQIFEDAVRLQNYGLDKGQQVGVALTPFGSMFEKFAISQAPTTIEGHLNRLDPDSPERKEAEAFLSAGYGPMQQVDDTSLLSSIGNPFSMVSNIVDSLFGINTQAQQDRIPVVTSPSTPVNAATVSPVQPISVPTATSSAPQQNAVSMFASMDKGSSDPDTYGQSWGDAISQMESNYDFDSELENF